VSKEPNYYRILGVAPTANDDEIKHAYRVLAKRYHPDAMPPEKREWAREQMARINAAYQVLQDPQRRIEYNRRHGYPLSFTPQMAVRPPDVPVNPVLRRRARERRRRETTQRWRIAAIVCGVLLAIGLILTVAWTHTATTLIVMATVDGLLLLALLFSLSMLNQ